MTVDVANDYLPDLRPPASVTVLSRASPANGVACMDIVRYLGRYRGSQFSTTGMQYSHVGHEKSTEGPRYCERARKQAYRLHRYMVHDQYVDDPEGPVSTGNIGILQTEDMKGRDDRRVLILCCRCGQMCDGTLRDLAGRVGSLHGHPRRRRGRFKMWLQAIAFFQEPGQWDCQSV